MKIAALATTLLAVILAFASVEAPAQAPPPLNCAPGGYVARMCAPCPPGRYSSAANADACLPCPIGTFSAMPGATQCTPCPPGRTTSMEGRTACDAPAAGVPPGACPPGYAKDKVSGCKPCAAGEFAPAGSTACSPCAVGSYTSAPGQAQCVKCPDGRTTAKPGAASCDLAMAPAKACPPGTYQAAGSTQCVQCPLGANCSSGGAVFTPK
jgi:ephrin receptor-like protein